MCRGAWRDAPLPQREVGNLAICRAAGAMANAVGIWRRSRICHAVAFSPRSGSATAAFIDRTRRWRLDASGGERLTQSMADDECGRGLLVAAAGGEYALLAVAAVVADAAGDGGG